MEEEIVNTTNLATLSNNTYFTKSFFYFLTNFYSTVQKKTQLMRCFILRPLDNLLCGSKSDNSRCCFLDLVRYLALEWQPWPPIFETDSVMSIATNSKPIWSIYMYQSSRPTAWLTTSATRTGYNKTLFHRKSGRLNFLL